MYKFIDLFAGIGGFHLAFHNVGAECVFASEIDKDARKTYEHNLKKISPEIFKENDKGINNFNDDIRAIDPKDIPDHDILCAGFPCQPFSQAGHKRGFEEQIDDRGNMFFILRDIIKAKRPKCIFLENVRHLLKHDYGRTFQIIVNILTNELDYDIYYKIIKASDYGLPQHRPRIFIVGFRKEDNNFWNFEFPKQIPLKFTMSDVWQAECDRDIGFTLRVGGGRSSIDDRRNWDSYRVNGEVKLLGPEQGKKMMGLPDWYQFPGSRTQTMKQLGNSVAVDAVHEVAKAIIYYLSPNSQGNQHEIKIRENKFKISKN